MMLSNSFFSRLGFILVIILVNLGLYAQKPTKVSGKVYDAQTKEPISFVNVAFKNSNVGASTDLDGTYSIDTRFPTDSLVATFLGYQDKAFKVVKESKQKIDFYLESSSLVFEEVTINAKKKKYSRKNNPAVTLIENVMAHKQENMLKGKPHYSFDKHEKIELDLNNITKEFQERKIFDSFRFMFEYVDTSEINGRPYLPIFLRETLSNVYYRKDPKAEKEHVKASKSTEYIEGVDQESMDDVIRVLYQDIDIYEKNMDLLGQQFIGPMSGIATLFYRFYILDTVEYKGAEFYDLAFTPKNKLSFGFSGNLLVSKDGNYTIRKADLGIHGDINLNFVRDLKIEQVFEKSGDHFILEKDQITIDYALSKNGVGMYGVRTVNYDNYSFDPPDDLSVYSGVENKIVHELAYKRPEEYWQSNRIGMLTENETGVYQMLDSLQNVKAYKRLVGGLKIATTGFVPVGPVDIGKVVTFGSFNQVEGFRAKLGGETNFDFSKRLKLEGYGAYGFRDKAWKYHIEGTYSFNEDWFVNPLHHIHLGYSKETTFPGQKLEFVSEDNVLLSIRRGVADKMLFSEKWNVDYLKEGRPTDYEFSFERKITRPYGNLVFNRQGDDGMTNVTDITTSEIGFRIKYAPNQQFFQGREFRRPILNKFPVLTVKYNAGIKGLLGGEYNYHKLELNLHKRLKMGVVGYSNVELEAGKVWGDIPYILMFIPRANQTFAYQIRSYNMMNFMEFVGDEFISLNWRHFFQGYLFNRIPLLRKLKLREVLTAKVLYGRLTDNNNPELDPTLIQLPTELDGNPTTFALGGTPYIEASFGFANIFKVLRLDFVKRLTYLNNPEIPRLFGVDGLGLRVRFKVEF